MIATAITYQSYARQIIALAALVCMIAVFCYGAFLLMVVARAAAQQAYQSDARERMAALASLEAQYLNAQSALGPRDAEQFGLMPVPSSRIAYEHVSGSAFSLRR